MATESTGPTDVPTIPEPLLKYFYISKEYDDTPYSLLLQPYYDLAHDLCELVPRSAERTVALRKLLESRDAILRAVQP